jgi:hypothetical protein
VIFRAAAVLGASVGSEILSYGPDLNRAERSITACEERAALAGRSHAHVFPPGIARYDLPEALRGRDAVGLLDVIAPLTRSGR